MTDTEGFVDPTVTGLAEPQPTYKALPESSPVFRSPHAFVVLVGDVPGNLEARAVAAEQNCPEGAVSLFR
ncbi:hypothetical protein [Mycobacterium sp. E1747]|uniref:hypothetical protein n=1 Tax=Mycobacterium sp. E1747 TaxID=1834128 RepID=UPI000801ADF5|nr:hypothetical protein [Mycobacterium sp. E1747]OBH05169.1 hypothetical protein A5695_07805 [Mycobacterium sp. E1747]